MKKLASVGPNRTAVAPVNPLPKMVRLVPPAGGPWLGLMPLTTGRVAAEYVKPSAPLVGLVLAPTVTVMSTRPAEPAGLVAKINALLDTKTFWAAVVPNLTTVAPVKPRP